MSAYLLPVRSVVPLQTAMLSPSAIVVKNCGIAAGGFQPGNTCARGGSGGSKPVLSADEFKAALVKIPMGSKIRVGMSDGTTMVGTVQARAMDGSSMIWRAKVEGAPGHPVSRAFTAGKVPATSIELADDKAKPKKASAKKPEPKAPVVDSNPQESATAKAPKSGGSKSAQSVSHASDDTVRSGVTVPEAAVAKMDAIAQGLTASQKKAVASYTLSDYSPINSDLMSGKAVRKYGGASKVDEELYAATNRDLPSPVVVHRIIGMDADKSKEFMNAMKSSSKSGEPITFPAYSSTTLDASQAIGHQSGSYHAIAFEIVAKKGLYVDKISSNSGEQEVILPKGSKFNVVGVKDVKYKNSGGELRDTTVVQLEQL